MLVSCREEGLLSLDGNVNAEPAPLKLSARLNVSNETRAEFQGRIHWALRRSDASILREGEFEVAAPALRAVWLPEQDFSDCDPYGCYYSYELTDGAGRAVGGGSTLFCPPKHFRFTDPKLEIRLEGDAAIVTARAYARGVEILCGPDVVLEDNFFDMNAGERRVRIVRGQPGTPQARSVYDIR